MNATFPALYVRHVPAIIIISYTNAPHRAFLREVIVIVAATTAKAITILISFLQGGFMAAFGGVNIPPYLVQFVFHIIM